MAEHRLAERIAYQLHFRWHRLRHRPFRPGVSILLVTWNRARFLRETLRTLAETVPAEHELLVLDNASTDDTARVLADAQALSLNLRVLRNPINFGTSAYAQLALHATREWLFELDDDVLLLPPRWFEHMTEAFRAFPDLGYLALDVVQDEFTTGAKPSPERYACETRQTVAVEFGPAGGWATLTPHELCLRAGGFPFRPHKPFFSEDAFFMREVAKRGRRHGLLHGVRCYHATGALWNTAFGYDELRAQKSRSPGAPVSEDVSPASTQMKLPTLAVLDQYRS